MATAISTIDFKINSFGTATALSWPFSLILWFTLEIAKPFISIFPFFHPFRCTVRNSWFNSIKMEYEEEEYPQQEENILLEIPPVNGAATDCMELCYSELRRPFQPNAKRNKNFKEKRKSIIFYFYNIIVSYGRYYNKFNHIIINIICVCLVHIYFHTPLWSDK